METGMFSVALDGNELLQKFVARRVSKEQEMSFTEVGGGSRTGYVTGIDEEWLQITQTEDLEPVLIQVKSIHSVVPTGRSVRDLSPEKRERIRNYAYAIRRRCQETLAEGK